jgi:hypothetical protein
MRNPKMMPDRPKPYPLPMGGIVSRVDRSSPVPVERTPLSAPKGKGGELWQQFYANAQKSGFPDPEKFADTALRSREKTHELQAKRHKLERTNKVPGREEGAMGPPPKTKGPTCKARTLANRPCPFGVTSQCGQFCKKHAVK